MNAFLATAILASCLAARGQTTDPAPPSAARFWQALETGLETQRQEIPTWLAAADSAAARYVAGGRLWAGGSFPDFDGEACNRAGGFMAISPMRKMGRSPEARPGSLDVVFLGLHRPRPEDRLVVDKLGHRGLMVVGFGSRNAHPEAAAGCDVWLEPGAPQSVGGGPAAAVLTVANLWAFQGEVMAACLRRGRMPTIWQSIMLAGSEQRNARYLPHRFHDDVLLDPVPPGQVAAAYLDSLGEYVARFRELEWGRLQAGARILRAAAQAGGTAYACPLGGHLRPNGLSLEPAGPGLGSVSRYATAEALADTLAPGDALYIQGYTDPPAELLAAARRSGAKTVLSLAGRQGRPPARQVADVVLDAQWELGDAAVPLAGYDVRLLPPSGFMSAALYWALALEAEGPPQ